MDTEKEKKRVVDSQMVAPMPKQSMSSYMCFASRFIKKTMQDGRNLPVTEITKEAGKIWGEMSEAEKAEFVEKAEEDKERFKSQMEEVKTKGYFDMADGSKSTDHMKLPKKQIAKVPTKDRGCQTLKLKELAPLTKLGSSEPVPPTPNNSKNLKVLQPKKDQVQAVAASKPLSEDKKMKSAHDAKTNPKSTSKQAPAQKS